jgi:hypothetical protein
MEVSSEGGIRYRVKICPMRVIRGYPGQGRIQGFDSSVKRLLGKVTANQEEENARRVGTQAAGTG